MKTKHDFTKACNNCKGLKTWFIEEGYDEQDYVIEIWTHDGYTIGDNEATTERINVIYNELNSSDGWHLAVKAVETIKQTGVWEQRVLHTDGDCDGNEDVI